MFMHMCAALLSVIKGFDAVMERMCSFFFLFLPLLLLLFLSTEVGVESIQRRIKKSEKLVLK